MDLVKKSLSRWIQAAIILTVGILCIIAGASNDLQTSANAQKAISTVMGVTLVVIGALSVILAILIAILVKKSFAANAIPGGFALAIGISLLCKPYAAELIYLLIYIIPFILIVLGSIILADGVYLLVRGILSKKIGEIIVASIVIMVIGITALVLGILCVNGNVISGNIQCVVFGIVVAFIALMMILLTFVRLPDAVVTVVEVDNSDK